MKKRFLYLALASFAFLSCREDVIQKIEEVSIETQNTYDDQAALEYLQTHSFDAKGNVQTYIATDTAQVKLADLIPAPVILPSGVIYVMRPGAQPDPGTAVGTYDVLHLMSSSTSYIAASADNKVTFTSASTFRNTIDNTGVPEIDPAYYYVKNQTLNTALFDAAKQRSYYEIEGFQEAIKKFRAFDIPDESNYNLQGLIIVPSRAAFARDDHYVYTGISLRNRSFVFNFQLYKSIPYTEPR